MDRRLLDLQLKIGLLESTFNEINKGNNLRNARYGGKRDVKRLYKLHFNELRELALLAYEVQNFLRDYCEFREVSID